MRASTYQFAVLQYEQADQFACLSSQTQCYDLKYRTSQRPIVQK
jgi:hypothetical protein